MPFDESNVNKNKNLIKILSIGLQLINKNKILDLRSTDCCLIDCQLCYEWHVINTCIWL